jgi:hypothetical protein
MKRSAFPFVRGVYGRVRRCRRPSRGQSREGVRAVGVAIVTHDPLHGHAGPAQPGDRPPQEPTGGPGMFIWQDLRIRQPRRVVDADVGILPADAARPAAPIPRDPMPHPPESSQGLGIHMEQLPRVGPFIPLDGRGRLEGGHARQTLGSQLSRHSDLTHAPRRPRSAPPSTGAVATPRFEPRRRGRSREDCGGGGTIDRAARAPLAAKALHPLAHRAPRDAGAGGDGPHGLAALQHPADQGRSTLGRRPGILVNVHPSLRAGVVGCFATTSLPDEARVNNLLRLHT